MEKRGVHSDAHTKTTEYVFPPSCPARRKLLAVWRNSAARATDCFVGQSSKHQTVVLLADELKSVVQQAGRAVVFQNLLEDIRAYHKLKPPKVKPNVKCYSATFGRTPFAFPSVCKHRAPYMEHVQEQGHCMAMDAVAS